MFEDLPLCCLVNPWMMEPDYDEFRMAKCLLCDLQMCKKCWNDTKGYEVGVHWHCKPRSQAGTK